MIPNLFGSQVSPTSNMLIRMLESHKLRSTYDFEKAVSRKLNLDKYLPIGQSNNNVVWNFRLIDAAAGTGTAVDTIFKMKEQGIFKGAKRKLNFMGGNEQSRLNHKCAKLEEMNKLMGSLELTATSDVKNVLRESVKVKLSDARAGWHGKKKTPPKLTPTEVKKKRSVKFKTTPSRGQSLMLDFINCTPKGKLTFGCREEEEQKSPK